MSRLPIRLRLTLPYAVVMVFVLAAMGLFVYVRVADTLLKDVDQNLRAQAAESRRGSPTARACSIRSRRRRRRFASFLARAVRSWRRPRAGSGRSSAGVIWPRRAEAAWSFGAARSRAWPASGAS